MEKDLYEELKKQIAECKTLSDLQEIRDNLNKALPIVRRRIDKAKSELLAKEKIKPISKSSMNRVAKFVTEEIFPGTEQEIKTSILYDRYKKWNRKDLESTKKTYSKNKFYKILKLGKRVQFKHTITGDYFIFELDKVSSLQ